MTNENLQVKPPLMERIKRTPVTYGLIGLNILIFILLHLTNILIADDWMMEHFAKFSYGISINKEYYRMITAVFMHEDLLHLFFNSFALLFLGRPIEMIFGRTKFLLIFLISGVFGTLFSFIFSPHWAIGASGGVFGIFGTHVYLFLKNREIYLKFFGKDILQLLVINVIIGFIIPNVDFWGHFGGLFGGFIAASTFGLSRDASFKKSILIGCVTSLVIFSGLFVYFNHVMVTHVEEVEALITDFDTAFQAGDYETMRNIHQAIEDSNISIPPSPIVSDRLLDYLDQFIPTTE